MAHQSSLLPQSPFQSVVSPLMTFLCAGRWLGGLLGKSWLWWRRLRHSPHVEAQHCRSLAWKWIIDVNICNMKWYDHILIVLITFPFFRWFCHAAEQQNALKLFGSGVCGVCVGFWWRSVHWSVRIISIEYIYIYIYTVFVFKMLHI